MSLALAREALAQATFQWDWHKARELGATDSLRLSKMRRSDRDGIARAVDEQLRSRAGDLGTGAGEEMNSAVLDSRIMMVDLDGEGTREAIVQGSGELAGCSATGNCPLWIFKKSGGKWRMLLWAPSVQSFTIQPVRGKRFPDIVLAAHRSAFESELTLFRYSHGAFRASGCEEASWLGENDPGRQLKEPRLRECP